MDPLIRKPLLSHDELEEDEAQIEISYGQHRISLVLSKKLGEGAFGTVFKAQDERGRYFALKKVSCQNQESFEAITQEIGILTNLDHENIVKLYAFDYFNSSAILIMEYCEHGDLNARLSYAVDHRRKIQWMLQLTKGLNYLHMKNIVHRDLKTENILLKSENILKISDFGISRQFLCLRGGNQFEQDDPGHLSEFMGTFAGTPFWVAPEVFDNNYDQSADIFSLGVTLYSILEQRFCMFEGKKYYGLFVKSGHHDVGIGLAMFEQGKPIQPEFSATRDIRLSNIICKMVTYRKEARASLENTERDLHIFDELTKVVEPEENRQQIENNQRPVVNVVNHWNICRICRNIFRAAKNIFLTIFRAIFRCIW